MCVWQGAALAVDDVDVLTAEPARGGRVDVRIDLMAAYDSPFDQDEIAEYYRWIPRLAKSGGAQRRGFPGWV